MKRELTEAERKMAQKIADAIGTLDELVFPENPIPEIAIVRKRVNKQIAGYCPPEKGGESYGIRGYGIDKEMITETKKHLVLLELLEKKVEYENFPWITENEVIIGIASHEVRHRVQRLMSIELFSPEIKDKIENPHLKGWIGYIKLLFEEEPTKGDYRLEFDAKLIEFLIIEMWHQGERDISKIVSIVKTGAKEICPFDKT